MTAVILAKAICPELLGEDTRAGRAPSKWQSRDSTQGAEQAMRDPRRSRSSLKGGVRGRQRRPESGCGGVCRLEGVGHAVILDICSLRAYGPEVSGNGVTRTFAWPPPWIFT